MEKPIGFDIQTEWEIKGGVYIGHILEKCDDGSLTPDEIDDTYASSVILTNPNNAATEPTTVCTINLVPSHNNTDVFIEGISLISEAKFIEVHSQKQGYLGTGKGTPIKSTSGAEIYVKDVLFEKPVPECSIKFLKYENKDQLRVFKIRVRTRGVSPSMSTGSINYDKVQELLDDMGQTIPDEAKSMLQSVRNYQQSHVGASSMMSPGGGQAAGMTGLLAMMSRLSTADATGVTSPTSQSITEGDLMNMMQGMMGGQTSDSSVMLDSLRNICGTVSKQRQLEETVSKVAPPVGDSSSMEATTPEAVLEVVDKKISDMEKKIMTNVDEKLQGVETRIMSKLDLLLNLMADKPPGGESTSAKTGGDGDMALD
ncbi:uncharacterized protein LOC135489370 [Lineus longissimus]|uniref:uncharacterized protein LOC135489370 n=1 Tax=Lineus longissimus TaxID=88925 RepID=UPI002B4F3A92